MNNSEEMVVASFNVLFRHLPLGTEKGRTTSQLGQLKSWLEMKDFASPERSKMPATYMHRSELLETLT
jgi:hypothetical protein